MELLGTWQQLQPWAGYRELRDRYASLLITLIFDIEDSVCKIFYGMILDPFELDFEITCYYLVNSVQFGYVNFVNTFRKGSILVINFIASKLCPDASAGIAIESVVSWLSHINYCEDNYLIIAISGSCNRDDIAVFVIFA
jgi:hypothetical protein